MRRDTWAPGPVLGRGRRKRLEARAVSKGEFMGQNFLGLPTSKHCRLFLCQRSLKPLPFSSQIVEVGGKQEKRPEQPRPHLPLMAPVQEREGCGWQSSARGKLAGC